jgi:hypothetical protein
MLRSLQDLF